MHKHDAWIKRHQNTRDVMSEKHFRKKEKVYKIIIMYPQKIRLIVHSHVRSIKANVWSSVRVPLLESISAFNRRRRTYRERYTSA